MNKIQIFALSTITAVMLLGVGGCSDMSRRDQNTLAGAGIGAVGGSILSGGSALGTVGGAAVGGIIGHEIQTPRRHNRHN